MSVSSSISLVDTLGLQAYHDQLMSSLSSMYSGGGGGGGGDSQMADLGLYIATSAYGQSKTFDSSDFPYTHKDQFLYVGPYGFADTVWEDDFPTFKMLQEIDSYGFYRATLLSEMGHALYGFLSVKKIGSYAFYGCSDIKSISMPMLESMGALAFTSCSSLSQVIFGEKLSIIPERAFENCTALTSASFAANTVNRVGYGAFQNCTGLSFNGGWKASTGAATQILSAARIDDWAFSGCKFYSARVSLPISFATAYAFADVIWSANVKQFNFNVPASLEIVLTASCFKSQYYTGPSILSQMSFVGYKGIDVVAEGNEAVKKVFFNPQSSFGYIDGSAFKSCPNLSQVVLSASYSGMTIGYRLTGFANCSNLTTISPLENVVEIGMLQGTGLSAYSVYASYTNIPWVPTYLSECYTFYSSVFASTSISYFSMYAVTEAAKQMGVFLQSSAMNGASELTYIYISGFSRLSASLQALASPEASQLSYVYVNVSSLTMQTNAFESFNHPSTDVYLIADYMSTVGGYMVSASFSKLYLKPKSVFAAHNLLSAISACSIDTLIIDYSEEMLYTQAAVFRANVFNSIYVPENLHSIYVNDTYWSLWSDKIYSFTSISSLISFPS